MGIRSNNSAKTFFDVFSGTQLSAVNAPGGGGGGGYQGHVATGGFISDWSDPGSGNSYRTHIFTSPGTFQVTALNGNYPSNIDYLIVGGGGGGGHRGGGGGAGGLRSSVDETGGGGSLEAAVPIAVDSYQITVGQGGAAPGAMHRAGLQGGNSTLSYNGGTKTANGGGGGGSDQTGSPLSLTNQNQGQPGGSGGGGSNSQTHGNATANQGYIGRAAAGDGNGGGGGAGGAGTSTNSPTNAGGGGPGVQVLISGPATTTGIGDKDGSNGQWFAGGGGGGHGGGSGGNSHGGGGTGGGTPGSNPWNSTADNAMQTTGGGGGGGGGFPMYPGGWGAPGIVAVRYQIGPGSVQTAKATGGAVTYYNGKTIHTFLTPGTFETTANWVNNTIVEYVVVGGGGSGGETKYRGGGGGAGAYKTGTTTITSSSSQTITIGQGGKNIVQGSQGPDATGNPGPAGNGGDTVFGNITAPGGGMGGSYVDSSTGAPGRSGGSGGGAGGLASSSSGPASGDSFPGTIGATPSNGWGGEGGSGSDSPIGAGGGGAGGNGNPNAPSNDPNRGMGGPGVQVPTTFRNPATLFGSPGPNGGFYLAGGGNAGGYSTAGNPRVATVRPAGGGGFGGNISSPQYVGGEAGLANTGGGGGGASSTDHGHTGGMGGCGIVLIAYPT